MQVAEGIPAPVEDYSYDAEGNRLGGPGQEPLIYVAPEDRITTVTDRKGQITEIEVNRFGSIIRITDPLRRTTLIDRDEMNLAVRVEKPAATGGTRVDTVEYDDLANVLRMTAALGTSVERSTSYEYEPVFNNVIRQVDPGGYATLWQPHSTRAALSRLRAAGHVLVAETAEGRPRRYRIMARQTEVSADVPTATATGETR